DDVQQFLDYYGMEISVDKSAYTHRTWDNEVLAPPTPSFIVTDPATGTRVRRAVKRLQPHESYRYLGYLVNLELDWTAHIEAAVRSFVLAAGHIMRLKLLPILTRIECLNLVALPSITYHMSLVLFPRKYLAKMDSFARAILKSYMGVPR